MDLKGAKIRNILQLCNDDMQSEAEAPLRVNISYYQRPYKWDDDRVQNLIQDFYKNKTERNDNMKYFVGSVVLVSDKTKPNSPMDIVDGQQRITTVFLLNFIRFLLLRAKVDNLIYRSRATKIYVAFEELINCYTGLVAGGNHGEQFEKYLHNFMDDGGALDDLEGDEKDQKWEELLVEYRRISGLPSRENIQADEYNQAYCDALYSFIEGENLAVQYSRPSYNANLKKALSHIVLKAYGEANPKLTIQEYDGLYEGEKINRYLGAIQSSFDALCRQTADDADDAEKKAEALNKAISDIVDKLQFCVVITGNVKDAYTLFEVLNDRAMEVDDLDLIKNLFYKTYCNNTKDSDVEIDRVIGEEDKRWGDKIFTPDMGISKSQRISYFSTVYLTGSTKAKYGRSDKYRETIEKDYLDVLEKTKGYGRKQLISDIDIFEMVAILLDKFEIKESRENESALKAQNDKNISIACTAMRLFQALKQDGVAAALVNIIIKTFKDNYVTSENPIEDFKEYIKGLRKSSEEKVKENGYKKINDWARKLWKASLMAKDYNLPREIARTLIQNVSAFNDGLDNVNISNQQVEELKTQFFDWTYYYKYGGGSKKDDIKIKILFHELYGTKNDDGKINKRGQNIPFSSDLLQLDHLEPENPNEDFKDFYYEPSSQNQRREDVVGSLGNMMLIDLATNKEMSNRPIDLRLRDDYCEEFQGHWIIDATRDLLKKNGKATELSGEEIFIPKDDFFEKRRKLLQNSFLETLGKGF